jgi:glucose-6-phosphate isomerase
MKFSLDTCQSINRDLLPVQGLLLAPYVELLKEVAEMGQYLIPESSINLPTDARVVREVETMVAKKVTPALRYIFVIGIGGSNLGTKAIYDALNAVPHEGRELVFIDTVNASLLQSAKIIISTLATAEELLLVSISKSGGTSETLANTEILIELGFTKWGNDIKERLVVITDEDSEFEGSAIARGVDVLSMPKIVGGRFSVFTAVGLFPLAALGVPIAKLLEGATEVRISCLNADMNFNPAAQSALVAYQAYQHGQIVHDTFVFDAELESLGKWYRQLLGESIGKTVAGEGDTGKVGIVPTVSIGSTDLHSVGQLYLGGPARTLTTFVYSATDDYSFTTPTERLFEALAPTATGKTTRQILDAILSGTKVAYNNQSLPFMEITLDGINPHELGAFMQFKMIEMMYLGRLFGVDAFNQPAVELYKVETKRILEGT